MNYQSKNSGVRALLDRPRWQEWVEFELEHINNQMNNPTTRDEMIDGFMAMDIETAFPDKEWLREVQDGGHEVERMLLHLAKALGLRYHRYLHRGLTSSNVIDSCNHRRWESLWGLLQQTMGDLAIRWEESKQEVVGMTHGRRAHRTFINTRWGSYIKSCYLGGRLDFPISVFGGPTGSNGNDNHRQAWPRHMYWPIWCRLSMLAYAMEQIATDYRFYCSDLAEAVGVTGTMAPGVATTSSAMPGKVNPTVFERVCSVGYMVRTMCTAQMLQPPKWLDADLVHSALERETIDRIWDHTFWLVEEMTRLVSTTKLEVTREPVNRSSFDALQEYQEIGKEYSAARAAAANFPTG